MQSLEQFLSRPVIIGIFTHSRQSRNILTNGVSYYFEQTIIYINCSLQFMIWRSGMDPVELKIQFNKTPSANERAGDHPGRYHLPTAPEVALLMPRHIRHGTHRQIVCDMRDSPNSRLTFIPDCHQCYFPFMYSVLSPYGTNGWHYEMRSKGTKNGKITLPMWIRWHIMTRPDRFNHIIHSGKLFQQFLVDMWAIKEMQSLNWMKKTKTQFEQMSTQG